LLKGSLATIVSLAFVTAAAAVAAPAAPEDQLLATVKSGAYAKLGPWLGNLAEEYARSPAARRARAFVSRNPVLHTHDATVAIEGYANDPAALASELRSLGATHVTVRGSVFAATVPVAALRAIATQDSLRFATEAISRPRALSRPVVSQGDLSFGGPAARAAAGVDGSGIMIGAMSDSFECNPAPFLAGGLTTTAAEDQATGELPSGVLVIENGPCPGTDEGRGMMQLMYDVAPGATQAFHSATITMLDFAVGILELADAGADVIVDDVIYFAEPMYSDGMVGQAADFVAANGVPYFSSAGNQARDSYEVDFAPTEVFTNAGANLKRGRAQPPVRRLWHDFDAGAGVDTLQRIQVTQAGGLGIYVISLQWDQPHLSSTAFAKALTGDPREPLAATSDLDALFYDANGILVPLCPPGLAIGITCQISGTRNIGGNAVDVAAIILAGPKPTAEFDLAIQLSGGAAPAKVKYVEFELQGTAVVLEHVTASGTAYGHANAAGAESVGASSFYVTEAFRGDPATQGLLDTTPCGPACLNDFSSAGGIATYLDALGHRLATAELRVNPGVTGPDGGNTTFFFFDSTWDDDDMDGRNSPTSTLVTPELDDPQEEFPNFFGTSASAPHVAAVAALMLERAAQLGVTLSSQQVYEILRETARPMSQRFTSLVPFTLVAIDDVPGETFDFDSGYGFVDAVAALAAVEGLAL